MNNNKTELTYGEVFQAVYAHIQKRKLGDNFRNFLPVIMTVRIVSLCPVRMARNEALKALPKRYRDHFWYELFLSKTSNNR